MPEELNDHKSRAHALLSASSAARWLKCPPSAVAAAMYPNKETTFTREGTKAHEVAEMVASACTTLREVKYDTLQETDPEVTAEMIRCAEAYRDYIQEQITDPDATLLLEQRLDFSPWVPNGFGTGDCIIIQRNTLHIIDYKYGKGVEVSAVENPQMRLYALGALNEFGMIYDVDTVQTHIFQPRIGNISTEELSRAKLEAWGETIKPVALKAAEGKGRHVAGDHCRWCPHAGDCPTLARTCSKVFDDNGGKTEVPCLAPFQVAAILQKADMITAWLKAVKDRALMSLLDGQEVPGYKVVEGKQGNRKWDDDDKVYGVLLERGYKTGEVTETKLLSPSQMDKAIGKKVVAELLADHVTRSPGAPTVVPASDKRPPLDRKAEAMKDFD